MPLLLVALATFGITAAGAYVVDQNTPDVVITDPVGASRGPSNLATSAALIGIGFLVYKAAK